MFCSSAYAKYKRIPNPIINFIQIIAFILIITPRLSVNPGTTTVKSNPFYTPFILVNSGYLRLVDINYVCKLVDVRLPRITITNSQVITNIYINKLHVSESMSIEFKNVVNPEVNINNSIIDHFCPAKPELKLTV